MTVGATQNASGKISSLELVKQINLFREQEGNKSELQHKNLLAVIRDEFEEEVRELKIQQMFITKELPNGGCRNDPYFELTLNQAKQVLVRESKFVRKAIIAYIDTLEQANKPTMPQTYLEALKALVVSEENRLLLQEENKLQQQIIHEYEPKVSYYDSILQSTDAINITVIAKDYGISAKKLNEILHELKIQYKQSTTWLLYQDHSIYGYTKTTTTKYNKPNGEVGTNVHTKWTQKGRLFLYEQLKAYGLIPVIERQN